MIVWTESCQRLRTNALMAARYGTAAWFATGGRDNGPSATVGPDGGVKPLHPAPSGALFFGGMRLCGGIWVTPSVLAPVWGAGARCQIGLFATGTNGADLKIIRGEANYAVGYGTVLATAFGAYDGAVRYVSFETKIDPAAGYTRVYLDGVEVAALHLDGVNTQYDIGGLWNGFYCGYSGTNRFCDLLVADGTDPSGAGHDLHEMWMDARVDYKGGSSNGYSSQMVGSDGNSVNNYELIQETTPDDDATFVESADPAIDGYGHDPVPAGATILGACAFARARKTDAGVAVVRVGLRSGSTSGMSDAQALATTYTDVYGCIGHDPADGAFTKSSIDAMEIVLEKA